MRFTKMHGAGNDYVFVDCFVQPTPAAPESLAVTISDRHRGVGADGLILMEPSPQADARIRIYNADGSAAEMCGNGIRCVAKYLVEQGHCSKPSLAIETPAGIIAVDCMIDDGIVLWVRVDMGMPVFDPRHIPFRWPAASTNAGAGSYQADAAETNVPPDAALPEHASSSAPAIVDVPLTVAGRTFRVTSLSLGNPHCVVFVPELSDKLVTRFGPRIEVDPHFPARVNVEFVHVLSAGEVRQRTWERGSGETLACGTGATAACIAGVLTGRTRRRIVNHLRGGTLELEWEESSGHAFMAGPAEEIFSGEWPAASGDR